MSKLKVFVTGANGLLGTNTIIELLKEGYEVVGFVRHKKNFVGNIHKDLILKEGDLLNTPSIENAINGCDYVVHAASMVDPSNLYEKKFFEVNVQGTYNVIETAIKQGVKKVVYIGTANVFGFGTLNDLGHEFKQMKPPFTKSYYSKSKKAAQDYIFSKRDEINIISINPTFIIGAYDTRPSSGKLILHGLNKRIVFYPSGGKSFVNAVDVAKGIVKGIKFGVSGESYIMSNENLSYKSFFKLLNEVQEQRSILIQIPKWLLVFAGYLGDVLRIMRFKTPWSSNNIKVICTNSFYSNSKSKKELGTSFSPIKKGLKEAVIWFNTNGYTLKNMS
ncbi:NAD-dependent epimerase/dehydratase family protein [Aestuariibaculum marinum]|uniref:NAD-dependent epimerase/dehydratase family protein n=1 Tax=Aestuariibaculum marinum TaxID=2683592 RepID=A0A8J6U7I7_9FLAO|nr:NAD-dependent epimerase/dehydratase family protein [Aestuariibaculum marinum]MBD0825269.1 NAD-dependent epimerase/dehydratase family protein [Aestuariibaculum marinum]